MQKIQNIPQNNRIQAIIPQMGGWGNNKVLDTDIIFKALKSICKIIIRGNPNDIYGTGFFMKISDTQK